MKKTFEITHDHESLQQHDTATGRASAFADQVEEALKQCNLCIDTLALTLPDDPRYWFESTEDLFYLLGIKDAVEQNIEQHGGYMIDEWQYVDARQVPMDIRSRIRFKTSTEEES